MYTPSGRPVRLADGVSQTFAYGVGECREIGIGRAVLASAILEDLAFVVRDMM